MSVWNKLNRIRWQFHLYTYATRSNCSCESENRHRQGGTCRIIIIGSNYWITRASSGTLQGVLTRLHEYASVFDPINLLKDGTNARQIVWAHWKRHSNKRYIKANDNDDGSKHEPQVDASHCRSFRRRKNAINVNPKNVWFLRKANEKNVVKLCIKCRIYKRAHSSPMNTCSAIHQEENCSRLSMRRTRQTNKFKWTLERILGKHNINNSDWITTITIVCVCNVTK